MVAPVPTTARIIAREMKLASRNSTVHLFPRGFHSVCAPKHKVLSTIQQSSRACDKLYPLLDLAGG
jgi:hypothetical protein